MTTPPPSNTPYADADYLNFALNLEYLEAEFYLRAATGAGLASADTGNSTSLTTGGSMVAGATAQQMQYIYEIAQNELDHVRFLRAALGSSAVAAPQIDLTNSFNALAMAAGLGSSFNPFSSYENYLIGAFIFEDVGVTAYHGAAKFLTSKSNLAAAAAIHAVEAYHAGSIRLQIVAAGSSLVSIANSVEVVRATLSGATSVSATSATSLAAGEETLLSGTTVVADNTSTGVGFERTTDEVLHIVYATAKASATSTGGSGVAKGGFFPAGLNGNITSTLI